MLIALEHGAVMPIHRHKGSSETCICIRERFEDYFYDDNRTLTDTIEMVPGGTFSILRKGNGTASNASNQERFCLRPRTGLIGRWGRER